jgi:hypothetical protein
LSGAAVIILTSMFAATEPIDRKIETSRNAVLNAFTISPPLDIESNGIRRPGYFCGGGCGEGPGDCGTTSLQAGFPELIVGAARRSVKMGL